MDKLREWDSMMFASMLEDSNFASLKVFEICLNISFNVKVIKVII